MIQPKITYKLDDITPVMEKEIKELVEFNLEKKMSSALEKLTSLGSDVEVKIEVKVKKNKKGRYEGKFNICYPGTIHSFNDFPPYKILHDLINHAFEKMSGKILAK